MTYIRFTDGRDRGHVKDIPFDTAEQMLASGQAVPVNFNEADPLGFRELPEPTTEALSQGEKLETAVLGDVVLAAHEASPEPASKASVAPIRPAGPSEKPAGGFGKSFRRSQPVARGRG
jgi:hypothetical protein